MKRLLGLLGKLFGHSKAPVLRVKSLVSFGATVRGDIVEPGGVKVDGEVVGSVTVLGGGLLLVSETGRIQGDVVADHAVIAGIVVGSITVKTLHVLPTGSVLGKMRYGRMQADEGSRVRAAIDNSGEGVPLRSVQKAA